MAEPKENARKVTVAWFLDSIKNSELLRQNLKHIETKMLLYPPRCGNSFCAKLESTGSLIRPILVKTFYLKSCVLSEVDHEKWTDDRLYEMPEDKNFVSKHWNLREETFYCKTFWSLLVYYREKSAFCTQFLYIDIIVKTKDICTIK